MFTPTDNPSFLVDEGNDHDIFFSSENSTESWNLRQLPGISSNGPDTPIVMIDMLVNDDDGIYFLLAQNRGPGRYSGDWTIQLDDITFNVRDYIHSCDTCSVVFMAKLGFDSRWDWATYLNTQLHSSVSLFSWSEDAIAISGSHTYQEDHHKESADFAVISSTGDLIESFDLIDNSHSDYEFGYLGSHGYKHYFASTWHPEHIPTLFDIDLCEGNYSPKSGQIYFYSLDSEFTPDLIFASTASGSLYNYKISFGHDIFTFHLPHYSPATAHISDDDAHMIYFDEGCSSNASMSSNNNLLSVDNFTQSNSSNGNTPDFVITYDIKNDLLSPLALMSTGCSVYSTIGNKSFSADECIIDANRNSIARWHLALSPLNNDWTWGDDFINLIEIPREETSPFQSSTLVLNLNDISNLNYDVIEYGYQYGKGEVAVESNYSKTNFFHSPFGVTYEYEMAKDGEISDAQTPWFDGIVPFAPFNNLPYNSANHKISDWSFYCECRSENYTQQDNIFVNHIYQSWDQKPVLEIPDSLAYVAPTRVQQGEFGAILVNTGYRIPYIYQPSSEISGVPVPFDGNHILILAKGPISDILAPFSEIATVDGVEELEESNGGSSTDTNPEDQDGLSDCEVVIGFDIDLQRTCQIPNDDIDWDDIPDSEDEDQDGDGRLDVSELSDSIRNNDPETMDMSVISTPYSETIHSLSISSVDGALKISVEYKVNILEFGAHLPLIAYVNEDGTQKAPEDYEYTLSSQNQLDRLETQMCDSPNLGGLIYSYPRFPLWLENLTVDSMLNSAPVECSWVERRSIDLMSIMMVSSDMEIANWKETIRYTISIIDQGQFSNIIGVKLPTHQGTQGKVWEVKLNHGALTESEIVFPWNENLSISIPVPPPAENQDSQQLVVTPIYQSGWSFIADVSQGQIDCSGYSSTVTDNLDDFYQQNDIEYNNLASYHEFTILGEGVYISCSNSLEFEEAMEGDVIEFCIYLFLDGVQEDSGCDSGIFVAKTVSGQLQTVEDVIDDFNQDLENIEQQWQEDLDDLFSTPESTASESSDSILFDDFLTLIIVAALLGGIIQSVQKQNKKNKQSRRTKPKHSSEPNSNPYVSIDEQANNGTVESSLERVTSQQEILDVPIYHETLAESLFSEQGALVESESNLEIMAYKQPPFTFSGEINEEGWEVCEYPRSSGIWWWKDYNEMQWVFWYK